MAPIVYTRVALARNACRLAYRIMQTQQPLDGEAYRRGPRSAGTVTATLAMPHDGGT